VPTESLGGQVGGGHRGRGRADAEVDGQVDLGLGGDGGRGPLVVGGRAAVGDDRDRVGQGEHEGVALVVERRRLRARGSRAAPARVELMYQPDVRASAAGAALTILDK
jgi:hypothetical protein